MNIKSIYIRNFKAFEKRQFTFDPNFNVAIGNNASGKSTLLHAVEVALGGYLQCLDIPGIPSNRRQFKKTEVFSKWNDENKSYITNSSPTMISVQVAFPAVQKDIQWTRVMLKNNTTSHNHKEVGELMEVVSNLIEMKQGSPKVIPIVASFGTTRKDAQLRKGKKAHSRRSAREKAFLAALTDKMDFNGVIEWLHNYDSDYKYGKVFAGTKEAIFETIERAIPFLKNVSYNSYYQELEAEIAIDQNEIGKTLHSNMSDGLKAMLNMVAELAFRCVILNGFLKNDAVMQTPGVVLIDELDMHLHPSWQKRVVEDLKNAFPKIQFIVSTHSPFIIQSLKRNELIILEDNLAVGTDPFRRSIEEIAENEMGLDEVARSGHFKKMEELATEYYKLIKQGKNSTNDQEVNSIRNQLNEMEDRFSEDPAFVALLKSERNASQL